MNKNNFISYIKTFFLTILTVFFVGLVSIIFTFRQIIHDELAGNNIIIKNIDAKSIDFQIQKIKDIEQKYKDNYRINLKLGTLYELKKDFKNAEVEYKKANSKAPYNEFLPSYRLALVYTTMGKLDEAQALMDNFGEKPIKKLIYYKANVYNELGNKYYEKGVYNEAARRYQKALNYYDVIKDKNQKRELKGNLASSYVYLAGDKVNEMKIDEAITYLKTAKSIINAPIINYKLGLLLTKNNPELACKYFEEVFRQEPSLINYSEYYNLLSTLAAIAENEGETAKAQLYEIKIRKIKKYYNENLLSLEDVKINDIKGKVIINKLFKTYKASVNMDLENTSNFNINSLYMEFVFKDKDGIIEKISKQFINDKIPLKINEASPNINIETKNRSLLTMPENITIQIYASKTVSSYKLLLKEITINTVQNEKPSKIKEFLQKHLPQYLQF